MSDAPAPPPETPSPGDKAPGRLRSIRWSGLRERRSLLLGGAGVLGLILIGVIVFLAVRPASTSVSSATPAPTSAPTATPAPTSAPTATPSPSGQQTPAEALRQRQQYRDYISVLVTNGTALAAATTQLTNCGRGNRSACVQATNAVDKANVAFQHDLSTTPPPGCLADADSQLRTGLGLQQKGLDLASRGVQQENRLTAVQGTILFMTANLSITQAVRSGRQAHC
jgi:hypothetical protein